MDGGAKVGLDFPHQFVGGLPVSRANGGDQTLKIGFHVRFTRSRAFLFWGVAYTEPAARGIKTADGSSGSARQSANPSASPAREVVGSPARGARFDLITAAGRRSLRSSIRNLTVRRLDCHEKPGVVKSFVASLGQRADVSGHCHLAHRRFSGSFRALRSANVEHVSQAGLTPRSNSLGPAVVSRIGSVRFQASPRLPLRCRNHLMSRSSSSRNARTIDSGSGTSPASVTTPRVTEPL